MTFEEFGQSLAADNPPEAGDNLRALWYAAKGDWQRAHEIVQVRSEDEASWVHAYLHRVEGDLGNAGYWYRQAGRPAQSGDLAEEWRTISQTLLG